MKNLDMDLAEQEVFVRSMIKAMAAFIDYTKAPDEKAPITYEGDAVHGFLNAVLTTKGTLVTGHMIDCADLANTIATLMRKLAQDMDQEKLDSFLTMLFLEFHSRFKGEKSDE